MEAPPSPPKLVVRANVASDSKRPPRTTRGDALPETRVPSPALPRERASRLSS